jgi:hypothetical protein
MFEYINEFMYIGKGEYSRALQSTIQQSGRSFTNELARFASVSTHGDNTLGKMVEYKAMKDAGFDGTNIPEKYTNRYTSGKSAWDANPGKRDEATKLAKQLDDDFNSDAAVEKAKKINYSRQG